MAAGAAAQILAKQVAAHPKCVRGLRARLDEAAPREEAPRPGELSFEGDPLVVE
jgi:hypothetical protein